MEEKGERREKEPCKKSRIVGFKTFIGPRKSTVTKHLGVSKEGRHVV